MRQLVKHDRIGPDDIPRSHYRLYLIERLCEFYKWPYAEAARMVDDEPHAVTWLLSVRGMVAQVQREHEQNAMKQRKGRRR